MKAMNTRKRIFELLAEGKSVDEIEQLLKDEKVKNIRAYIHRVNRDIRLSKKVDTPEAPVVPEVPSASEGNDNVTEA